MVKMLSNGLSFRAYYVNNLCQRSHFSPPLPYTVPEHKRRRLFARNRDDPPIIGLFSSREAKLCGVSGVTKRFRYSKACPHHFRSQYLTFNQDAGFASFLLLHRKQFHYVVHI